MRNVSLLLVLLLAVFAGCKKDKVEKKLFSFDIKNEKPFKVAKDSANIMYSVQDFYSVTYPVSGVTSSTEADFQQHNTTTDLVKDIKLQELILIMPDNSAEDFSFLQNLDVHIAMPDGSDPVLMAYAHDVPTTTGKKLVFNPSTNQMDKYVKAGNYQLILVNPRMRRPVTADLNITARITFSVTASPLN